MFNPFTLPSLAWPMDGRTVHQSAPGVAFKVFYAFGISDMKIKSVKALFAYYLLNNDDSVRALKFYKLEGCHESSVDDGK